MANPGTFPVVPTTDIGWLRVSIGDDQGVPLAPPVDGQADFPRFSDAGLQTILDLYPDDRPMQLGTAYQRVAMQIAESAQRVRVDDIEIDNRAAAEHYFSLSKQWFDVANSSGSADAFQVVSTGTTNSWARPEGTPEPYEIG